MGRDIFHPVQTRKTFEEAVAQIVEAIRDGELSIGDKLPSERALATQMEISRPTLREATRVLAGSGVIRVETGPGGGMFVNADLIPLSLLQERMTVRLGELSDVLEARRILEPRVVEVAAVRADEDDFHELARIIKKQAEVANAREHFMELDRRFHLAIARATRNRMVVAQMKLLFRQLGVVRDMAVRGDHEPEWSLDIHQRTLAAIMSRDLNLVRTVMNEHLAYLERLWASATGRGVVTEIPEFLMPASVDEPIGGKA